MQDHPPSSDERMAQIKRRNLVVGGLLFAFVITLGVVSYYKIKSITG